MAMKQYITVKLNGDDLVTIILECLHTPITLGEAKVIAEPIVARVYAGVEEVTSDLIKFTLTTEEE
jgi:hypothetical protein